MPSAKRELFKSPDVCQLAELQPYVLRTWEAEFPGLGQPAAPGTGRLYRRDDVQLVLRIKQLVFGEGLTLAGARRRLEEEAGEPPMVAVAMGDALGDLTRTKLRQLRTGLEAIMALLNRNMSTPELQLVAPTPGAMTARDRATVKRAMAAHTSTKSATKSGSAKKRRAS
jgi:DNA-binding transcriptional MerR regulator